ncbi:MAG: glycerophosphodiester phosphodiesterase [Methanolinea sp.]|nr:glycerophosphodiester phosphodiesterase [Methanolinea sp.]
MNLVFYDVGKPEQASVMDIIGHRGAAAAAPENTLSAVRLGMECADYVEVDVRLSRDHVPVIMHDPTVDRTTNGSGRVGEFTAADLRLLDAGKGEHVPTLEEVCLLVGGKSGLCIEIKEPGSELEVCGVLDRVARGPLLVVSFHRAALAMVHDVLPDVPLGLIHTQPVPPTPRKGEDPPFWAYLPRFDTLTRDAVAEVHARGMRVIPWTLDSIAEWERAREMGVDGFATDDPCGAWSWRKTVE